MTTLRDIAKKVGVSVPTVSRILNENNKTRSASRETELMVKQIARELNYQPNGAARSLTTRRTHNIGVLWDKRMDSDEETVFWSRVQRGVIRGCKQAGYECMVSVEDYHLDGGFSLPRGFRERYVDGVIVTYPLDDTRNQVQQQLIDSGIPFVVIWSSTQDSQIWSVNVNPNPGFRQALLHLYELGHRKMGYCVYPDWQVGEYHSSRTLEQEINAEFSIELAPIPVDLTQNTHEAEGARIANEIVSGALDITAMIMGDVISVSAIHHLGEQGIEVPADFSVVGLSDSVVCRWTSPRLTSIVQPLEKLGEQAVSLLVDNIKAKGLGVNLNPRHVNLPQEFVLRESTGPVSHKALARKQENSKR